ncbi:AraC family transcriptional regulator [Calothrix sp. NIES-4071]|nr:AraC family transcriptional regulator [Calothrix sp. NIES-4071]BAZ63950.1 AraC family transcriptional regulator [Calothrix sp. NIES-4105]
MPKLSSKTTKVWQVPSLDNLELFRAKAIHHSYARHSHPTYSIGVIESGIGGNYYRGATHVAEPYSIIFMNPDETHTGYCVDNLPLTYRMLYPSTEVLQNRINDLGTKIPYFPETVVHDKNLARKIQNIHCILETSQNALELESLFIEVLSLAIARHADIKVNFTQIKLELAVVGLIKDYLHDNYNSNVSLEQLVELTNLNRFYLIRLFRNAVGLPPYAYLTQIRVERAKQLLREGKSIADVAFTVGMSDQSHLSRHFKRIVGISPGLYRSMSISFKTNAE